MAAADAALDDLREGRLIGAVGGGIGTLIEIDPATGARLYEKLITGDKVDLLIGDASKAHDRLGWQPEVGIHSHGTDESNVTIERYGGRPNQTLEHSDGTWLSINSWGGPGVGV